MRTLSVLAVLVLVGCPTPEDDTDTPDPTVCEPIDAPALSAGGVLPAGCWLLQDDLTITGDVVIEDDVRVVVDPDRTITVTSSGSLDVQGTADAGVVIEGADEVEGSWTGLGFDNAGSPDNRLSYVTLRHACGDRWNGANESFGALWVEGGSRLAVEALTVETCAETAVHVFSPDADVSFDGVATRDAAIPMRMSASQAGGLSGTLDLQGADDTVHLDDGAVDGTLVLPAYRYTSNEGMTVTGAMTVEAGAHVAFAQDRGLDVVGGSLSAVGTETAPIVFTGTETVRGYWLGVHFEASNSADNRFEHVEIRHAASDGWTGGDQSQAGLYLQGDEVRLTMIGGVIDDAEGPGLVIDGGEPAGKISIDGTVFSNNAEGPAVTPDAVGALGSGVVVAGNDTDHIRIFRGAVGSDDLDEDVTWLARDVPYFVENTVFVFGSLHIDAGATVAFDDDQGLSVGSWPTAGGLLTVGDTAGPEVTLTGGSAVAGFWRGVAFQETFESNAIQNTRIEYAGSSGWNGATESQAALFVYSGSQVDLTDVTFADNEFADLYALSDSLVTGCSGLVGTTGGDPTSTVCVP